MKKNKIAEFLSTNTWSWALIGTFIVWLAICGISGNFSLDSLVANAYTASFVALVALGQMMVVTTGHGALDLSLPGMIMLAAFLQVTIINGDPSKLIPGLLAIIGASILVGIVNAFCVVFLQIPPMIATMAINYILTSICLILNVYNGVRDLAQVPFLVLLAKNKIFGIYVILYIIVLVGALFWFMLKKTTYGRSLIAMGQNDIAAHYAGINTTVIQFITYVFASLLGGLAGLLISVRAGGAFLGMADTYLLQTVGAVVLGGTLMSGGKSSVPGTIIGAMFLTIIVTVMQVANFSSGMQNIVQGVIIILIIIVATPSRKKSMQV